MTVDYCNLFSTECEYRLLLDIVWSHNKSSSYPTLHCCQTVNTKNIRNHDNQKELILCSLQWIRIWHLWLSQCRGEIMEPNWGSPATWSPHTWRNKFDPLASLTIIEGVEPLEPQPENWPNPFQKLLSEILTRNSERTHRPEPKTETEMATDDKNGSVKLNLPKAFDENQDKFRKFLQTAEIYFGINKKVYNDDLKKIGFILSFMTEGQAEAWADQFVEEPWTWPRPRDLWRICKNSESDILSLWFSWRCPQQNKESPYKIWQQYRQTYYDICHPLVRITIGQEIRCHHWYF